MLIDDQMKFHELQAIWWVNAATNGHAGHRKMYHGVGNKEFSKDELTHDAMETAQRHILLFMECAEYKHSDEYKSELSSLLSINKARVNAYLGRDV